MGIRQGAACAKVLWQAVVRLAEEQGKAGRSGEWRVPVDGAGLGPRSTGMLLGALAGTSQGTRVWSPVCYLERPSRASDLRDSKNCFPLSQVLKFAIVKSVRSKPFCSHWHGQGPKLRGSLPGAQEPGHCHLCVLRAHPLLRSQGLPLHIPSCGQRYLHTVFCAGSGRFCSGWCQAAGGLSCSPSSSLSRQPLCSSSWAPLSVD